MYGEWVIVNLGVDIKCKIWVVCTPTTPKDILQRQAMQILKSRLPEKKEGIFGLGDSLKVISDYEYSQGIGVRFKVEQELNEMIKELS